MISPSTSALELAKLIRAKKISPLEALAYYQRQTDTLNDKLNAIVWRRDEQAQKEAQEMEAHLMRTPPQELPPFFGVPIPLKDLTEALNQKTTHGSQAASEKLGRYDATAVSLMRQAGFVFTGRSNSPEFGTLPVTDNSLYGATRNPWDLERTPGGSSGGAAAAVAAGMAPIAHASDGGGSIRIPASCCGLVGLKPSRARVPKGPFVSEIMHGISSDLCVSKTVADTAAMLDALSCFAPHSWYGLAKPETPFLEQAQQKPARLRIAFTTSNAMGVKPAQACTDAVNKAATLLADLGHEVFEAKIDWTKSYDAQAGKPDSQGLPPLARDFITLWCTATCYMEFPDWSKVEPLNLGLREMAMRQSSHDYIKALVRLQLFSQHITSYWQRDFDVLLTPVLAMEPPRLDWLYETKETDPAKVLWRCTEMVPYPGWCNITGQPALALPVHMSSGDHDSASLPIGIQLVGAPRDEVSLLKLGVQLEEALCWPRHTPC